MALGNSMSIMSTYKSSWYENWEFRESLYINSYPENFRVTEVGEVDYLSIAL